MFSRAETRRAGRITGTLFRFVARHTGIPNIHDPDLQSVLYGQEDHVRIYALKDYMCRLEQAGFEVAMAKDPERIAMLAFATQPGEEFILVSKPGIISTSG